MTRSVVGAASAWKNVFDEVTTLLDIGFGSCCDQTAVADVLHYSSEKLEKLKAGGPYNKVRQHNATSPCIGKDGNPYTSKYITHTVIERVNPLAAGATSHADTM